MTIEDHLFDDLAVAYQPWIAKTDADLQKQAGIQDLLIRKAGASFGENTFVAEGAHVFTNRLALGDRSWIAAGAIIRGDVEIESDCSVNPYAHIAGKVKIGRGCRIASLVSIYGFNHGFSRLDVFIKDQPGTSVGVTLHENVWVGANAVIVDGVEIGSHSIIAAGAVVTKSFPEYQIIAGNPAKSVRDRRTNSRPEGAKLEKNRLNVRRLLYDVDPYSDLKLHFPVDLQGWGSNHPIFRRILSEIKPQLVVEVGTWKGASAIHMAEICNELGLSAEIVCIDTWLGNWQHWSRTEGVGSRVDLHQQNGFPMLYFQFLSNVINQGYADVLTPLPLTSMGGAKLFRHYNLSPHFVYIDGDHEYEAVITDLHAWLSLLADGGVLIGDDYDWPGVKRAVDEILENGEWNGEIEGNKFSLRRK